LIDAVYAACRQFPGDDLDGVITNAYESAALNHQ
jgi:hypothetical protein